MRDSNAKAANREVAMRFASNLVTCRRRAGYSQEELGFLASLHRTEIGMLERGARIPRIDTVIKLAGALETPPEDLLAGMGWQAGFVGVGEFSFSFKPREGKAEQ